jgi:hypothetical protein
MATGTIDQLQNDSVDKSRQQLGYSQNLTDELKKQENLAESLNQRYSNQADKLKSISEAFKSAKDEAQALSEAIKDQLEALKKTNEYSTRYAELNDKIKKAGKEFAENKQKSIDIEKKLGDINSTEATKAQKLAQQYVNGLTARYKIDEKINELTEKRLAYDDVRRTGTDQSKIEAARKEYLNAGLVVRELKKQMEAVNQINTGKGQLLKNLSQEEIAQLQAFALAQKQMDIARNTVRNHQDELNILEQQLNSWQKIVSKALLYVNKLKELPGVQVSLDFINKQLNTIGISFDAILKNVLALDKTLTEFGKSVQVSKEGARILADSFQETSYRASEINKNVSSTQASIKNQIEANNELNKSLGTGALFTEQSRLDQIELVKGMGLQGEEGAKIYGLGKLNNMTAHQTAVAIGDQVVNTRKATGITLDYRKVLTDVAKVGGQLAAQYKNNPALLAQAVTQAQLLGLTLEQTAKMGSSLVDDFAGSLSKELEAELLTGKALNLEQARYYALMGDSAKAAKELMDNVGGIEEYQQLNVLQQKSLAAAIGLTTDELATSLKQQELLKGTSFETQAAFEEAARQAARTGDYTKLNAQLAQAANGEQLASQASQISNQEKFQMAIEKLQETVANLVNGPFGTLIDKFATLLGQAGTLKFIVGSIAGIIGIKMVGGLYNVGLGIAKSIPKFAALAAEATFMNAVLTGGLGLVVAAAAAAAGYAIINSLSDGEASVSGAGGGGGVNVPNSGVRGDRNVSIILKNENVTYVGGQKMSQFSTEQQKTVNTRTA